METTEEQTFEATEEITEQPIAQKSAYSGQLSLCALSGLKLTNDPCNALNWQSFVEAVIAMSAIERNEVRESLGDSDVDHLKNLILDVHLATELSERLSSVNALEQSIGNYSETLQPLLTALVFYSRKLGESEANLQRTKTELDQKSKSLTNTQEALRLAQEKIDAITNIEQQLNSEGALTNDDEL
jgi:hypothetical protein